MKSFFTAIMIGLFVVFLVPARGITGAVILGLAALAFDWFWQWLRLKQVGKHANRVTGLLIMSFFFLRLLNVFVFIKIGSIHLSQEGFTLFSAFLLCIPIVNLIAALTGRQRGLN
jgi:hypothetical protein